MVEKLIFFTFFIDTVLSEQNVCYEGICIPENYSKFERPLVKQPVEVEMFFSKIQIMEIDDMKSIIKMYLYMDYEWQDPRILGPKELPEYIPLNRNFKSLLWRPDFYIEDLHSSERQLYIDSVESTEHLWLGNDSYVALDLGFRCSITCKMRFDSYPFDSHKCYLKIASWSFNTDSITLSVR